MNPHTLHPVPLVGFSLLLSGLYLASLATCLGCPIVALGAGIVAALAAGMVGAS